MWGDVCATLRPYTRGGGALYAVLNTTDEKLHKQVKGPIAPIFSMTSTTSFEGLINDVLKCLVDKFDRNFAVNGEIFAFDVMRTLAFSKRYEYLDTGTDIKDAKHDC